VFPTPVAQLPPPTDIKQPSDLLAYAAAHRGVPAYGFDIMLTIQAPTDHSVVLTGMHPIALARHPAVNGTYLATGGGCGGVSPRWFEMSSLDTDPVTVAPQDGEDVSGNSIPYKVSATDPEVFMIQPNASNNDVDWELELDWIADGKIGKTIINDAGKPFHFTGTSAAVAYMETNSGWAPGGFCRDCRTP
jgi:hypothetical protein